MKDREQAIILKHFNQCRKFLDEQKEIKKQVAKEKFPMLPSMYHRAVGAYTEIFSLIKELGLEDYVIDDLLVGE